MKRFAIIMGFWMALATFSIQTSHAQVVVVRKPARPAVVVKPRACGPRQVWIAGHWQWNRRARKYIWVKGTCVRKKLGQTWVAGRWIKVPGGFKWVPGHWQRR